MGSFSIISVAIGLAFVVHVRGFSKSEETALAQFRGRVEGTLPQEFMKSNAFLIRWLRVNDLNVGEAEAELKTYLEAREKEGVDNIKAEDVRGMANIMPWRIEGVDKQGRPIIEYFQGKCQFRRLALAGKSELASKYLLFNMEKVLRKTIELAEMTGKDIDSFYLIADIDGFNARDHLCVSCFSITVRLIQLTNSIAGHFMNNCIGVNAPRIFAPVTTAVKQFVRSRIVDTVIVYDTNKANWQKALAKDIDLDQLPPRLGGTNTQFDQKKGAGARATAVQSLEFGMEFRMEFGEARPLQGFWREFGVTMECVYALHSKLQSAVERAPGTTS